MHIVAQLPSKQLDKSKISPEKRLGKKYLFIYIYIILLHKIGVLYCAHFLAFNINSPILRPYVLGPWTMAFETCLPLL